MLELDPIGFVFPMRRVASILGVTHRARRGVGTMSRRQSFFAYAALLVGVFTFASSFSRPSSGQQTAPAPTEVGRYQIATAGNNSGHYVYLIDTATGKLWSAYSPSTSRDGWKETISPVVTK